jgi:DNA integrity scanning protein DisA with diadenylate cyclase activity
MSLILQKYEKALSDVNEAKRIKDEVEVRYGVAQDELNKANARFKSVEDSLDSRIAQAEAEHVRKSCEGIERDISDFKSKRDNLILKSKAEVDALDFDAIYDDCLKNEVGLENLEAILGAVEESFSELYGRDVTDTIKERIESEEINEENFDNILDYVRQYQSLYLSMDSGSEGVFVETRVRGALNFVMFDYTKLGEGNELIYWAFIAILTFLLIFTGTWWIFPYFLVLFISFVVNFVKSGNIYNKYVSFCFMFYNLEYLRERVTEEANKLYLKSRRGMREVTASNIADIDSEVERLSSDLESAKKKAKASFSSEDVVSVFNSELASLDVDIGNKKIVVERVLAELHSADSVLRTALKVKEDSRVAINEYYVGIGEDRHSDGGRIFPSEFLIDWEGERPNIWKFPRESICIIYNRNQYSCVVDFLRLITAQLMLRMSSTAIFFNFIDTHRSASEFMIFASQDDDVFKLHTRDDDVGRFLDETDRALLQAQFALREYEGNIDKYNEGMLRNDSVPQEYTVNFFVSYKYNILDGEFVTKLLSVSNRSGFYNIFFVDNSEFEKPKVDKQFKVFFEHVQRVYVIMDSNLVEEDVKKYKEMTFA